jgi:hypothetical protein
MARPAYLALGVQENRTDIHVRLSMDACATSRLSVLHIEVLCTSTYLNYVLVVYINNTAAHPMLMSTRFRIVLLVVFCGMLAVSPIISCV